MPEENGAEGISSLDSAVTNESSVQNDAVSTSSDASAQTGAADDAAGTQTELNEFQLESELTQFESEVKEALATTDAEKDPKWYRNSLEQYGRHLGQLRDRTTPYQAFQGVVTPEQLPETVEMLTALNQRRMVDGVPKPDVGKFLEIFEKNYGDVIQDIVFTLGGKSVPGSDLNYFATALQQQYGISPNQLEAVKSYIENNTLPEIAPDSAEAYKRLTPRLKEEYALMSEDAQRELLDNVQRDIDRETRDKAQSEQQHQTFVREVETAAENRYLQGAQNAMEAFAKTLSQAQFSADPMVNELIIEENLQMVLNALNPYSAGYARARAAIAKTGLTLDETRVNGILDSLAEESRNIEYYSRKGDSMMAGQSEAKYARALQQLIAQGHNVAGQILKVRGQGVMANQANQNGQLQQTNGRPVINGNPQVGGNASDWMKNLGVPGTPEYRRNVADLQARSTT